MRIFRIMGNILVVLVVALGAIALHETAHLAAARVLGIKIVSLELLPPAITVAEGTNASKLIPFWYAGGVTAGIMLLFPLVVWRGWFRRSFDHWVWGLAQATMGWLQIVQGILEGTFHMTYVTGAGEIFSVSHILTLLWLSIGLLPYLALFPLPHRK